jgi:histidinol phosphatase-like PHP family hydrolase
MSAWRPTDCHAHTRHSDGKLTVAELVARAAALGTRPSVTDHISRDSPTTLDSPAAVVAYLDDLDRYDVLRGGEFCWHDDLWRELPPDTVRRFTHRLGSLHAVRLRDGRYVRVFSAHLPEGLTPMAYMEAHVASLEALAGEMPVDILAHPTIAPPPLREIGLESLWSEALEERAIRALQKAGIAFEISARYPPHERIVRRAAAGGLRLSLGSDGHSAAQVADVSSPLAMARLVGIPDAELYDPERHGSRTGAFDVSDRAGRR